MRRRDVRYAVVELLELSMDCRVITAAAEAKQCSAGAEFAQVQRRLECETGKSRSEEPPVVTASRG